MDLVIMNPPFTRDSLRHDQLGAEAERRIKEREKQLLATKKYRKAARLHSSGGMFTVLGTEMLKDNGRLAMVLPTIMTTSPGNREIREYMAGEIDIEIIVSSHDPKRIFFSENTNIGEVLIIGRRRSAAKRSPTRFINLARNPRNSIEALDTVHLITNGDVRGFTEQTVDAESMERGEWYAVNFYSPYLYHTWQEMAENLVRLDSVSDVGQEGKSTSKYYHQSEHPTRSGRRALWYHKADVVTSMRAQPDVYIEPKPAQQRAAERYWKDRSRLLLPQKLSLPSVRVVTAMLDEKVLGSIWTPCRPRDDETAAAICVWFNSSPGVLAMLAERDNRKPPYPQFSLDTMRSLRVPAFTDESRDALATAFEEMKDQQLRPLPEMNRDPVRMRLDDIVADALGYDREWVARVRKALSEEPSITNVPLYDDDARQGGLL